MKKYLAAFVTLFYCGAAFALPIGNPYDPEMFTEPSHFCFCHYNQWWNARVGFYGDYVFERHTRLRRNGSHLDLSHTRLNTNAGFLAINLWHRLDLYATFGASHLFIRSNTEAAFGNNIFLETNSGFSWSIGGHFSIYRWRNWLLGGEAQYFSACPRINYVRNEGIIGFLPAINYFNKKVLYQEWQVGGALAYFIGKKCCDLTPIPYIGLKWSGLTANLGGVNNPGFLGTGIFIFDRLENQRNLGFAVGVTLVGRCRMSINIEGRFADERAFSINSQFRF